MSHPSPGAVDRRRRTRPPGDLTPVVRGAWHATCAIAALAVAPLALAPADLQRTLVVAATFVATIWLIAAAVALGRRYG